MDTALQAFCEADPGFAQFVERHGYVASTPQVRKEYKMWQIEQVLIGEENYRIMAQGEAKGEARGKAEGRAEGMAEAAKNLLRLGVPVEQIIIATGLAQEEVARLRDDG